ncbi:adhesion G-protein coupled receptor G2-like [Cloeon dipterum]|uniref:adhesion G-protein coupled receptor G2-like n=1 Tax=Cloeon dipterum TaxID=197152 RepID=UPI00321FCFE7
MYFWCVFAAYFVMVKGVQVNLEPLNGTIIVLHVYGKGVLRPNITCKFSEYENKRDTKDFTSMDCNMKQKCFVQLLYDQPVGWILCDVHYPDSKNVSEILKAMDRLYYVAKFSPLFDFAKFHSEHFTAKQVANDMNIVHFTSKFLKEKSKITVSEYKKYLNYLKQDLGRMENFNKKSIAWIRNVKFCQVADNVPLQWNETHQNGYKIAKCVGYYFTGYFIETLYGVQNYSQTITNITDPETLTKEIKNIDYLTTDVDVKKWTPSERKELLDNLDLTIANLDIKNSTYEVVAKNIAIGIVNIAESKALGLFLERGSQNQGLSLIQNETSEANIFTPKLSLGLKLPGELLEDQSLKLNAILIEDSQVLFQPNFISSVISVTVGNSTQKIIDVKNLSQPIILWFNRSKNFPEPGQCVYWDYEANEGNGNWSNEGCHHNISYTVSDGFIDECICYHLTHFGSLLLMGHEDVNSESKPFEVLSIVGCSISLLGLSGVFVTAAGSPQWRKGAGQKILLQMAISLAFLMVMFLLSLAADVQKENRVGCIFMGFFLHYAILVNFFWMLVAGYLQYKRLVQVIAHRVPKLFSKSSMVAWGCPLVPGLLIVISTHWDEYHGPPLCLPQDVTFFVTILAPVVTIMLVNLVIFCLILKNIFMGTNDSPRKHESSTTKNIQVCKLLFFLFVLLGLSWIFALCQYIEALQEVFTVLFNLTVTFQGVTYFIYMVALNKKARAFWLATFKNNRDLLASVSFINSNNSEQTVSVASSKLRITIQSDDSEQK